jgi:hypothetical protein
VGAGAVLRATAGGHVDDPLAEISGQRSVIRPIPAYSRTALMPETAPDLSENGLEMATTVPSGALSLNLKYMFSSVKSSKLPVIVILLNAHNRPRSTFSGRVQDAALQPGLCRFAKDHLFI